MTRGTASPLATVLPPRWLRRCAACTNLAITLNDHRLCLDCAGRLLPCVACAVRCPVPCLCSCHGRGLVRSPRHGGQPAG